MQGPRETWPGPTFIAPRAVDAAAEMPPSTAGRAVNAAGQLEGYEIFLKYLPAETTEESLRSYFAEAGTIVGSPRLLMDPRTNKCKGVGWITFSTVGGMNEALSWDGCAYGGRHLSVTAAKQQHTGIRPSLQEPGTCS